MKKILLIAFTAFIFQSCASPTILVDRSALDKIPKGSTRVVARSKHTPSEVFSIVAKDMAKNGCPVKSDKESMQIICDGKSVEGGTQLKAMAFIEEEGDSSKVTFSGEWGLDATGQIGMMAFGGMSGLSGGNKIVWEGVKGTKPCIAYQHLVLMAEAIPGAWIKFTK